MENIRAIEIYKEHNTHTFNHDKFFTKDDIDTAFAHESHLFNSIEDGISILDNDLNIIRVNFTMKSWYAHKSKIVGKKCYAVYHDKKQPCDNCPILEALHSQKARRDIVAYYMKENRASGWHELQGFPIMDGPDIVGIVEYVKDITYEVDLYSKIGAIEKDLHSVKSQNELLKTYIEQKDSEKRDIESNIKSNVRKYIKPVIKQIRDSFSEKPVEYELISFLDNLFEDIITPYLSSPAGFQDFTSREIQIMSLVRAGSTSKEIAQTMCLSKKTVDFHRANIRKKLNLEQGRDNLRAYLIRSRLELD